MRVPDPDGRNVKVLLCGILICLVLVVGCHRLRHAKLLTISPHASFDDNYKAVGVMVKAKFPKVISQDDYDRWNNAYIMDFVFTTE